jgi:thiosulfate dehydrogenase
MRAAPLAALLLLAAAAPSGGRRQVPFPSSPAPMPDGAAGAEVRRGMALVMRTRELLPKNDPGTLSCANCHLAAGRKAYAVPLVGVAGAYPAFRDRLGREETLAERVNDCFERSLNGTPLAADSVEMRAILAYIGWLSAGVPADADVEGRGLVVVTPERAPSATRGEKVYGLKCARCHGLDGSGQKGPGMAQLYPALWGDGAFNIAASMARAGKAAGFIRRNMPKGMEGSLTDQQAADVAEYMVHRPRPDFAGKAKDWPNGGKPADARY